MKHLIFSLAALSAVYAGPDLGAVIDYDAQDDTTAKMEEIQQPAPEAIPLAPLLMPIPTPDEVSNCGFSIDVMGIRNFTQDGSYLKDAPTAGLRFNKCIGDNTYVQVGYDRVFSAKYKNATLTSAATAAAKQTATLSADSTSCPSGCPTVSAPTDCDTGTGDTGTGDTGTGDTGTGDTGTGDTGTGDTGTGDTGTGDTGTGDTGTGDTGTGDTGTGDTGTGDTGTGTTPPTITTSGTPYAYEDTNLDRLYVNIVHEFNNDKQLFPYIFGGVGYEHVSDEAYDVESQAFYDLGAGLKYRINDTLNLITEAKGLKKFNNNDLDIVAGLGLGVMLGSKTNNVAPGSAVTKSEPMPELQPETQTSVLDVAAPSETLTLPQETPMVSTEVAPIILTDDSAYYIQVATMFHQDLHSGNSAYLSKLDAAHLNYEIKESTVRGKAVQLLLVGPYYTEADAKADLSSAKRIEKDAFVKKIEG